MYIAAATAGKFCGAAETHTCPTTFANSLVHT